MTGPPESGPSTPPEATATFLGRAVGATLAGVLAKLAAAAAGVIFARLLGPSDRGAMSIAVLIVTLSATAAVFGIDVWLLRSARAGADIEHASRLVRHHLIRAVPIGIAVIIAAAVPIVGAGVARPDVVAASAMLFATTAIFMPYAVAPLARRRMRQYAAAIGADAFTGLILSGVVLLAHIDNVALCLVVLGLGRLAGAATASTALRTSARTPTSDAYRRALSFGAPSMGGALLTHASYRLDVLLVALLASSTDVGLYVSAAAVMEFAWVLPDAIGQMLVGHVRDDDRGKVTAQAVRVTVFVVALFGLAVSVFGSQVMIAAFGEEYVDANRALGPLAVATVLLAVWKLLVFDLAGRDDTRIRVVSAAVGVSVMLMGDIVLIPSFGIVGAATASALGYGASCALVYRRWSERTGGSVPSLVVLRGGDVRAVLGYFSRRR